MALLRMERSVRPGDMLCLLGGDRVAVCLGSGSNRVAPGAIGRRLARALEDRLALGDTGLGLDVTIGIGVDSSEGGADPAVLAEAAMSSLSRRTASARPGDAPPFVTVTWVPGPNSLLLYDDGAHRHDLGAGSLLARRLRHRALVPVRDDFSGSPHGFVTIGGATGAAYDTWDGLAVSALDVLLVDPDIEHGPNAGPLLDIMAELTRRSAPRSVVSTAADVEGVLFDLSVRKPDVVVLALGAEHGRHDIDRDPNLAWDRPARIARAVRDMGTPVIAVSMGASAAALAVCVEQGAIGLFHSDLLAQELARQSNRRLANGNGNGSQNGHDDSRSPGQLPPPYHALVRLTPSERRVLFHMMEGRAAADIATTLVVSLTTVRSHIRSILRKLNVNSQLAAVALAFGTMPDTGSPD